MPKQIISASEMERYGYCPLSWYLDLRGIDAEGDEVNTGVEKHKVIGDSLKNLLVEEEKSRETSTTLMTIIGLIMALNRRLKAEHGRHTLDNGTRMDADSGFFPFQIATVN